MCVDEGCEVRREVALNKIISLVPPNHDVEHFLVQLAAFKLGNSEFQEQRIRDFELACLHDLWLERNHKGKRKETR